MVKWPDKMVDAAKKLDRVADMTQVPTREAVGVAMETLEKAAVNANRSQEEHGRGQYDKSATELQQAVEKGAKSWHLLAGWLSPTEAELRGPGHEAYRLWVDRLLPFYSHVREISAANLELAQAMPQANFLLKKALPMAEKASSLTPEIPPQDLARLQADLAALDVVHRDRPEMWRATLQLDRGNRWVNDALSSFDQPDLVSAGTVALARTALPLIAMAHLLADTTPGRITFSLGLGRGMKGTLWLPLLTAWHDQPARYAASTDSYWTPRAYTKDTPFVQLIPTLVNHARTMVRETSKAAEAAEKLA